MATRYYLMREGETDPLSSTDPYHMPLTAAGARSFQQLAELAVGWRLDMLCVSTLRQALDSADLVEQARPVDIRWDLTELEDLVLDDLNYDPRATHLVSTWTDEQIVQGLISLWTRLMAAFARIDLYARTYGLQSVAIIASERVLNLLIANWLGADWRLTRHARFSFGAVPVCCVTVDDDSETEFEWIAPLDAQED